MNIAQLRKTAKEFHEQLRQLKDQHRQDDFS
jgi:hypothetical protein